MNPRTLLPPDMDAALDERLLAIPQHCREGLARWLRYAVLPGHFLVAVLSNDLKEACGRADEANRVALYDYVFFLHNYAPSTAWGSPQNVAEWVLRGQALREKAS